MQTNNESDLADKITEKVLEKLNTFYSEQPSQFFPQKGQVNLEKILLKVQDKGGLYFGLFPKFEWIEHIRQKIWENIEYPIGKGLRDQVWN